MGVQYRTTVSWDASLVDVEFVSDTPTTRKAGIAGLARTAGKITAGAPSVIAGRWTPAAIVQNFFDGSSWQNIGTTAVPSWYLI